MYLTSSIFPDRIPTSHQFLQVLAGPGHPRVHMRIAVLPNFMASQDDALHDCWILLGASSNNKKGRFRPKPVQNVEYPGGCSGSGPSSKVRNLYPLWLAAWENLNRMKAFAAYGIARYIVGKATRLAISRIRSVIS